MQIPYFCFHDIDLAPEGKTLRETFKNVDEIVAIIKDLMAQTGKKLLWGTANLFGHPRFMHGAATSPNADVFAYAASAGEARSGYHQRAGWRELCVLGRPEGTKRSSIQT